MDMSKRARVILLVLGLSMVGFTAAISLCKGLGEGFSATPGQHEAPRRR